MNENAQNEIFLLSEVSEKGWFGSGVRPTSCCVVHGKYIRSDASETRFYTYRFLFSLMHFVLPTSRPPNENILPIKIQPDARV